jgi:hypothetical protein
LLYTFGGGKRMIDPQGRFLYARVDGGVSGLAVDARGSLRSIGQVATFGPLYVGASLQPVFAVRPGSP